MTLRELLKALNATDEAHLDKEVLVSPHTGGYDSISNVSVLYVGHPVIHLAQPRLAQAPPDMWIGSQEGPVPSVSPDDLRNVWKLIRDAQAQHPGECTSISSGAYKRVCSPGADVHAVWFRASMIGMLQIMSPESLAQWRHNGELDDVVFHVAATFPMEKMKAGVQREGFPFDVDAFVKQIGAQT